MPRSEFTLEEVTRAAKEARALVAAHESRSPTSQNATLGENDALFSLYLTLKRMFGRIAEVEGEVTARVG